MGIITFGTIAWIDRIYGDYVDSATKNLLYLPWSKAIMRTSEFNLTYQINNLGFRGPDVNLEKSDKSRIAFIGDSFTFGWGVEEQDSWIGRLRTEHPDLELLNLGRGGTHPMDHAQLARKVLPILKPDHVFVCLTSWNDLIQMQRVLDVEGGADSPSFPHVRFGTSRFTGFVQKWFPNISRRFRSPANINDRWEVEAEWISKLNEKKIEHLNLSEEVKRDFKTGMLNPSGIYDRIVSPDSEQRLSKSDSLALWRTAFHLKEIDSTCENLGIGLSFIVLPNRPTNCPSCIADLNQLGAMLSPTDSCLINSVPETRLADFGIELAMMPLLQHSHDEIHGWYYPIDGHPKPEGNEALTGWLSPILEDIIQTF